MAPSLSFELAGTVVISRPVSSGDLPRISCRAAPDLAPETTVERAAEEEIGQTGECQSTPSLLE